jgi:hypothetical protein
MRKLILLFLVCWLPAFGAISATMQWDVRATGSDSNSGGFDPGVSVPGTDYSQQNSPQITYTDLVIGVTTTKYTSVLNIVSSALPGNALVITGGTGCTTGVYEVLSNATITATVDRSLGTAASVCTAVLGGSLATICGTGAGGSKCSTGAISNALQGNTVWVKSNGSSAVNTLTSAIQMTNANGTGVALTISGYASTHGDNGAKPLITTSTGSIDLIDLLGSSSAISTLNNLWLQSTGNGYQVVSNQYSISSGYQIKMFNCKIDIATATSETAVNVATGAINTTTITAWIVGNEFSLGSGSGVNNPGNGSIVILEGNYFHGGGGYSLGDSGTGNGRWIVKNNVFASNTRGIYSTSTSSGGLAWLVLDGNSFYGQTNENVRVAGTPVWVEAQNNVFYGGTYGMYFANLPTTAFSLPNSYGNIGTANTLNWYGNANGAADVALSANPFTNAGGGVFTLNSTAGGGAALKAAGFPGVTPAGTGYLDIGALQSQAAAGASIAAGGYVQ